MNNSINETCKIYTNAKCRNVLWGNYVILGEDCYVADSKLGNHVQINRRNHLEDCTIGDYTFTGMDTVIKHTEIGKYCSISWHVNIIGGSERHDINKISTHPFTQLKSFGIVAENEKVDFSKTYIGNDVWIGMNACILNEITIGTGAVIGAGSVVTQDVPAYAVVVGNPAKIIKYRFAPEIRDILLELQWWEWPEEVIQRHMELFKGTVDLNTIKKIKEIYERFVCNQ